jgi:Ni/Co efflux regulator RcnB
MKRFVAATALALTLLSGVVTTAQADNRDRHDQRYDHRYDRNDRHDRHDRHDRNDRRDWDRRTSDRRDWDRRDWDRSHAFRYYDGRRFDRGRYVRPHGYYYRSWHYGDYLPRAYYGRRYIVNDYYAYRLGPPPRGYHWVRVDNDIVLASIASGLVVSRLMRSVSPSHPAGAADGSYCWRARTRAVRPSGQTVCHKSAVGFASRSRIARGSEQERASCGSPSFPGLRYR